MIFPSGHTGSKMENRNRKSATLENRNRLSGRKFVRGREKTTHCGEINILKYASHKGTSIVH